MVYDYISLMKTIALEPILVQRNIGIDWIQIFILEMSSYSSRRLASKLYDPALSAVKHDGSTLWPVRNLSNLTHKKKKNSQKVV